MVAAEIALLGTVFGALVGAISSSWLSEYYKRYRDTKALAFALSGELASHLEAFTPGVIAQFDALAIMARENRFPGLTEFEGFDLVYDRNIDKLGLLEGTLPFRLVMTYGRIKAGRISLQNIARGGLAHDQGRLGNVISYHMDQWRNYILPEGHALVRDLQTLGQRGFWRSLFGPSRAVSVDASAA